MTQEEFDIVMDEKPYGKKVPANTTDMVVEAIFTRANTAFCEGEYSKSSMLYWLASRITNKRNTDKHILQILSTDIEEIQKELVDEVQNAI